MKKKSQIEKLTDRSKEIFRCLVETYLNTGEPVGSRTLAKNLRNNLSSSTIRNIMSSAFQRKIMRPSRMLEQMRAHFFSLRMVPTTSDLPIAVRH